MTMKILYIQKQSLDATAQKIMEAHKKGNDVTVVNIMENKNYDQIVDLIFSSDKVISW
jgi:hypothetical protein